MLDECEKGALNTIFYMKLWLKKRKSNRCVEGGI